VNVAEKLSVADVDVMSDANTLTLSSVDAVIIGGLVNLAAE
jgi:hypothetical protein